MAPTSTPRAPEPNNIKKPRRPTCFYVLALMAFLLITLSLLLLFSHLSGALNHTSRIPSNPTSWHRYVRASPGHVVHPATVLEGSSMGKVLNHQGLISGDEPTVLVRDSRTDKVPSVVIDFGINTVGILSIEFAGAEGAGDSLPGLRLAFSETLEHLSDNSDFTRSYNARKGSPEHLTGGTDQVAVETAPYTWTNQLGCQRDNQRVCSDGLHGFRYLRISLDALDADAPFTAPQGRVSISSVSLRLSAFLGTPDTFTGWFECSDEDLTQWWFDGVYTNDLCTDIFRANDTEPRDAVAQGLLGKWVLHDAPKRDRDPYVGDLAVAGLTTFMSHNTSDAVVNVLADLADHQRADGWIPPASIFQYTLRLFDYPLWWVVCTYDYVLHTGDLAYLDKYYPNMAATLDDYYPPLMDKSTGLVVKPGGYGDYAFLPRSGPVTYYNVLYVHALRRATLLARHRGSDYDADAERWESRATELSAAVNAHNFDAGAGAFFDGTCGSGGEYCATHAQDGNSIAIVGGVADAERAESILKYWASAASREWGNSFYDNNALGGDFGERTYAFISYFEIVARFETAGMVGSAFEEMRRLWGYMAARDPGVTFWEGTGDSYNSDSFKSRSHGWSTGVVPLLSRYVLGVAPTSPGFETWSVKPRTGDDDVSWARGEVPVPGGGEGIRVWWEKVEGRGFEMGVQVPDGLGEGKIAVPVEGRAIVRVNGEVVWDGAEDGSGRVGKRKRTAIATGDGYVEFEASGGKTRVSVGYAREL
ncbi:related to alpha-L-rhamnosidase A [Cephalotrichum gorgonifer]|uniref:Related to alpha-L-rhamnosidase A n=1 Tax=Cephalotrichum gorgonifer TaxID=2041049 RepID=A0AAE8N0Q1_9PEZI|nr:related to alpha-L-rhamnosidase A [Cephalotrichum gorgonifer]